MALSPNPFCNQETLEDLRMRLQSSQRKLSLNMK